MRLSWILEKKALLEDKLKQWSLFVEKTLNDAKREEIRTVNEKKYLVQRQKVNPKTKLSQKIEEAIKSKGLSRGELFDYVVLDQAFNLFYEERDEDSFEQLENEIHTIRWGKDRAIEISRDVFISENLGIDFNLKDHLIERFEDFQEFVRIEFDATQTHLEIWYQLQTSSIPSFFIRSGTSHDIIRCVIDEEIVLEWLNRENVKIDFEPKIITVSIKELETHQASFDGYCIKCGSFNVGNHEPDLTFNHCNHCGENFSFGMDHCLKQKWINWRS